MSQLTFALRNDNDPWEEPNWSDPGFAKLSTSLNAAGLVFVDTDEDDAGLPLSISLTVRSGREAEIRSLLDRARAGEFGDEVQSYWKQAEERD